jgi:hypothetical protein
MAEPSPSLTDLWAECSAIASRRSFELGNVSECLEQWRTDLTNSTTPLDAPDPTDLVAKCLYFESLEQGSPGLLTSAALDLRRRVRAFSRYASLLGQDISRIRDRAALAEETAKLDERLQLYERPAVMSSRIVKSPPTTFSEFTGKRMHLVYRGSRDGFDASQFHAQCDRLTHTATFIKTDDGYVFGGFTPLDWDSGSGFKADVNLESFVFTLKNPHGCPPRVFRLKESQKDKAICCRGSAGPIFGAYDIYIADKCNKDEASYSNWLGYAYNNDTGIPGTDFFTGKRFFRVAEIEVFAIGQ